MHVKVNNMLYLLELKSFVSLSQTELVSYMGVISQSCDMEVGLASKAINALLLETMKRNYVAIVIISLLTPLILDPIIFCMGLCVRCA